jgi:hypothetical protein
MTTDTPGLRVLPTFLVILLAIALSPSLAQAQGQTLPWPGDPSPQGGASPWPSPNGGSAPARTAAPPPMMGAPMAGPRQAPPPTGAQQECVTKFTELRAAVEKSRESVDKVAGSARSKSEKKASREDVCKALTNYSAAEGKWMKFIIDNAARCGMPAELGKQISTAHASTEKVRKNVCAAGPAGGPSGPPSLSDALGTSRQPVSSDTSTPRGTFDTLSGSALSR